LSSGDSNTLQINRNSNTENLLKIRGSNTFPSTGLQSLTCQAITEGSDYTIGEVYEKKYVFENKLLQLISEYSNYTKIKEELKVPEGSDFGISFSDSNGSIMRTTEKDVTVNIYSDEKQIEYVDSNGNIKSGKLMIKIW
jgi:hypothetical protein